MSLAESFPLLRLPRIAGLVALAAIVGGCTVQPLYSTSAVTAAGAPMASALASVNVSPVTTRQGQEVRNHLIFLLGGGQGNPSGAAFSVDLVVSSYASASASTLVSTTEQAPTASLMNVVATYTLRDNTTGLVVDRGTRQSFATYDVPVQQFAALRAERDAENRAAREVAELLRSAVAQAMARPPKPTK